MKQIIHNPSEYSTPREMKKLSLMPKESLYKESSQNESLVYRRSPFQKKKCERYGINDRENRGTYSRSKP